MTVALRTSRRNLRRNRARNSLIAGMVSLPVIVMVAVAIGHSSQQPTTSELLSAELGTAQARIQQVAGPNEQVVQSPDDPNSDWIPAHEETNAEAPPTGRLDASVPESNTAVGLTELSIDVATDAANLTIPATVGAAWDRLLHGRYTVVDGQTPTATNEVMLSPTAATRLGLQVGDSLTVDDHRVTVVGTLAKTHDSSEQVFVPDGLVDTSAPDSPTAWYIGGAALTWDQVTALNDHGMVAYSRDVVEHPPGVNPLGDTGGTSGASLGAIIAIAMGGGAIAILLAGSAFAVGLRREQRMLGMFAVTGADRRHVAAVSIATGAWLGLLGGVFGITLGTAIAWGLQRASQGWSGAASVLGRPEIWGFHIPWLAIVGGLVFAVTVGALSAAIPAVMASRRDPLASLHGALRPHKASPRSAATGLAVIVLGVAALVVGKAGLERKMTSLGNPHAGQGAWPLLITGAAIAIFAGLVLVMPMILTGLARLAAHAPLSARLAARDGARQSMRTVGVIVAISVSVLAVTATASIATQSARSATANFWSWSPAGAFVFDLNQDTADGLAQADPAPAVAAVKAVDPDASTIVLDVFPDSGYYQWTENPPAKGLSLLVPQQNLCPAYHQFDEPMSQAQLATDIRCTQWESLSTTIAEHVVVGGAQELEALLGKPASSEALAALGQGGAVVLSPAYLDGSSVKLGIWDQAAGNWPMTDDGLDGVPASSVSLPAVLDEPTRWAIGPGAVISPETAATLGIEHFPSVVIATTPGGFSQTQADAVRAALHRTGNLDMIYSAGPQPDINVQFLITLAVGLLVLTIAAAAISIGIARVDARNDDSTLMSVGAPVGITRLVAMWQALVTVSLAVLAGTGVGLAAAWALSPAWPAVPFVMPTVLVIFVVLGLPFLMALGALAFTRPARVTAYRLAA